ncbi:M81 family metallopeptidase [Roseomonas frigidaquae]|uniref:Microcystinase C n=1 Tax=Falsiroseomonas frigidaquae TaxID=487318 RepID=A0ABX1F1R0_9PROT|nr:M81 family metallopeptidase [Falsiroseomonas frigidaquae]NKE46280.1 M81 family metallopeptidase [Falsiroseomonas frigidaquae]
MRVLAAQIKHETNGFNRNPTTLADYRSASLRLGEEVARIYRGTRLEMGGFIAAAEAQGWTLFHPVCATANPSGPVTDEAFEYLLTQLLDGIRAALPLDGVLLALHGSMVTESLDDPEGEILRRVRQAVGPDVPVAVTLDPHGNVTPEMVAHADIMTAFRTSPHTDHYETARRAAAMLARAMRREVRPTLSLARRPMLTGFDGCRTHTGHGPMIEALAMAAEMEAEPGVLCVSIQSGYSRCDSEAVGPSVIVTGDGNDPRYQVLAERMMDFCWQTRGVVTETVLPVEAGIAAARAWKPGERPVVLGDFGDAPGGGGYGDGTAILAALIEARIEGAVVAAMIDPATAAQACAAGRGARIQVSLGGREDPAMGGGPVIGEAEVLAISDGAYVHKGPYGTGTRNSFGPSAALRIGGVEVIVASQTRGIYDLEQLRIFGIEPTERAVLAVKCMHGHRAAFEPISSRCLDIDSGGLTSGDPKRFTFRRVRRPVWPLDDIAWPS